MSINQSGGVLKATVTDWGGYSVIRFGSDFSVFRFFEF